MNREVLGVLILLMGFGLGYSVHAIDEVREQQSCVSNGHGWGYVANAGTETKGDGQEICVVYEKGAAK